MEWSQVLNMVNKMKRIFSGLIILMLLGGGVSYAGNYTDSAHGNSVYGVDRATPFPDYAVGNCAHCHEQHASIGGTEPTPTGGPSGFCLLADNFSGKTSGSYLQSDNACFYCHTNTGYLQDGVITNNDYTATFGGGSSSAAGIMEAFNLVSYHNLNDVLNFAKTEWSSTFTDNSNPCSGCHNIHIAQRSCGKPSGSYDPTKAAISKPSGHNNLWGNDAGERMDVYTSDYQAPYWSGSTTNYEPSSDTTADGSNLPDYVSFCTDCHNATNVITSTTLGTLKTIDWDNEKHGKLDADGYISVDSPYTAGTGVGYVLSCMDCHEPHGSPNVFLIRTSVNGAAVGSGSVTTTSSTDCTPSYTGDHADDWKNLCSRCHDDDYQRIHHSSSDRPYPATACAGCHSGGATKDPINCSCCHYHGSSADGSVTF